MFLESSLCTGIYTIFRPILEEGPRLFSAPGLAADMGRIAGVCACQSLTFELRNSLVCIHQSHRSTVEKIGPSQVQRKTEGTLIVSRN